jgi:2-hydroxychromene-2-carboxylate isomerase
MPRQIDYYFSLQSPWAYLGHAAFMTVVSDHDCRVNYKPVMLGEVFAETGGLPLGKRHPARQRYRLIELQRWRDHRGLTLNLRPAHWPIKGTLADQLVIAIVEAGHDPDAFLRRGFAAVWDSQQDLALPETLIALADESGLPGAQLLARAGADDIVARYQANRDDAVVADVFGSPVYVLDGELFWGQDRIDLLADALRSGRKPYRSDV